MKNPILYLISFLGLYALIPLGLNGQSKGENNPRVQVKGVILGSDSTTLYDGATIYFEQIENPSFNISTISSQEGSFSINIPCDKKYKIWVNYFAINLEMEETLIVDCKDSVFDLGEIIVGNVVLATPEVTVYVPNSLLEANYDIQNDPVVKGLTLYQAINAMTGAEERDGQYLVINGIIYGVKINGVDISGKNDLIDYLRQLPASDYGHISVHSSPDASNQANSFSGFIEVLRNKNSSGGTILLSSGIPESSGLAVDFGFGNKKIHAQLSAGFRQVDLPGGGSSVHHFIEGDTTFSSKMHREHQKQGIKINSDAKIEFRPSDKDVFTLVNSFNLYEKKNRLEITYSDYDENGLEQSRVNRRDQEREEKYSFTQNFLYTRNFLNPKTKLSAFYYYLREVELDVSRLSNDQEYPQYIEDETLQRSVDDELEKIKEGGLQMNINEGGFNLGFGLFGSSKHFGTEYEVSEKDLKDEWFTIPQYTNQFIYSESVYAGNIQAIYEQKGRSFSLGTRGEYTGIDIESEYIFDDVKRNFFDLFITSNISLIGPNKNNWHFSFIKAINRPKYKDLIPYYTFNDSRNIRRGNPDLMPSYPHILRVGYQKEMEKFSFQLTPKFNYEKGYFEKVTRPIGDFSTLRAPENFISRKSAGSDVNFTFTPNNKIRTSIGGALYYVRLESEDPISEQYASQFLGNINSHTTLNLHNGFMFQLGATFLSREYTIQGLKESNFVVNMGMSKMVFSRKVKLTMGVADLLNSYQNVYSVDRPDFNSVVSFDRIYRQFSLTLQYRFKISDESEVSLLEKISTIDGNENDH